MVIQRIHPARLGETLHPLGIAVVMDVLRATTTATVLMARGAKEIRVVSTPAALASLERPNKGRFLVVSELKEVEAYGERMDNSPTQALTVPLDGLFPVLVTTNGTRALVAAAKRAERVFPACFLNVSAVAKKIRSIPMDLLTLLPAGEFSPIEPRIEDELCADALTLLITSGVPNFSALIADAMANDNVQHRIATEPGFGDDVDIAFSPNRYDLVVEFTPEQGREAGWIRPAE